MVVTLKCGFQFEADDIQAVLLSVVDDIQWRETPPELMHGMDHTTEAILRPLSIAGVRMPDEGIAFIRIVTDSRVPQTYRGVESTANAIHPGKTQFVREDFSLLDSGDSLESAKLAILEEFKRFFRDNMPD